MNTRIREQTIDKGNGEKTGLQMKACGSFYFGGVQATVKKMFSLNLSK
jgi:hypothetical protein